MERKPKFKLEQPVYWYAGKTLYKGRIKKIANVETAKGSDLYYYAYYNAYTDSKGSYKQIEEEEGLPYEYSFCETELFLSEAACKRDLKEHWKAIDLRQLKHAEADLKFLEARLKELPGKIKEKKAAISSLKKKIKNLEES